jgi:ABC-type dipeptide/oligopeptide/nickel transport system permease subunit
VAKWRKSADPDRLLTDVTDDKDMTQDPSVVVGPSQAPPGSGIATDERDASLWLDAWRDLRGRPLFWISVVVVVVSMAVFPGLWASGDPLACNLVHGRERPSTAHPFGFTFQGCDMWASVVYGARSAFLVVTVPAFIMLGDLLRDALDPRTR